MYIVHTSELFALDLNNLEKYAEIYGNQKQTQKQLARCIKGLSKVVEILPSP